MIFDRINKLLVANGLPIIGKGWQILGTEPKSWTPLHDALDILDEAVGIDTKGEASWGAYGIWHPYGNQVGARVRLHEEQRILSTNQSEINRYAESLPKAKCLCLGPDYFHLGREAEEVFG
jgi:hypothetical protein